MNYKMVIRILAKTLIVEAVLMCLPFAVGLIYGEHSSTFFLSFAVPILGSMAIGLPLSFIKPKNKQLYAKEGFVVVALIWIMISLVGALPFVISGVIPNYIDAVFETVSGFTTTGSSIMTDVESVPKSYIFWRQFTHWVGGMGVLVFVLAIIPGYDEGAMHLFRSESPGPTVGKLVSKIRYTARILYLIYSALSVLMVILLVCGEMNLFESVVHMFSVAGTGGYGVKNDSMISYGTYSQMVIAVFMVIFSINFNVYFLIIIGSFKKAFKCEEMWLYLAILAAATFAIALNVMDTMRSFGEALKHAFFQVSSISSTTGFASVNFDTWPVFSKAVLLCLMAIGACGGSTGGGIKVSRVGILAKSAYYDVRKLTKPREIKTLRYEGETVDGSTIRTIKTFLVIWVAIVIVSTLLLSLDPYSTDFTTPFTSTLTCLGNVGPGLSKVGPICNFSGYTALSKLWLSFIMLLGRLEIFPMLILFSPGAYKKH